MAYETKRRETLLQVSNSIQSACNQSSYTKSHLANLENLFNFTYSQEIYEYVPVNYFLIKAKKSDYLIIYPSLLRLVLNLFTQLCQVEHCLFEPKTNLKNKEQNADLNDLLDNLKEIKSLIPNDDLTRNSARMLKRRWLKAYSIHGRK